MLAKSPSPDHEDPAANRSSATLRARWKNYGYKIVRYSRFPIDHIALVIFFAPRVVGLRKDWSLGLNFYLTLSCPFLFQLGVDSIRDRTRSNSNREKDKVKFMPKPKSRSKSLLQAAWDNLHQTQAILSQRGICHSFELLLRRAKSNLEFYRWSIRARGQVTHVLQVRGGQFQR